MAQTEILLETGTNEIEIMQFTIYGELYGINVAKVREIMMAQRIKPVPHSHPAVEGLFKQRDILLTVVDLPYYLTGKSTTVQDRDLFIVTNFNNIHIAFRVQSVEGISRISWKSIQKPDRTLNSGEEGVMTGIAQCDSNLVTILDFEKIVADIAPSTGIQMSEIEQLGDRSINETPIVMAEDSILLTKMIEESLNRAGYVNQSQFNNGQEAWDYLYSLRNDPHLLDKVGVIITDIEMPEMDGHRLTKLIKDDPKLKKIPVIIFSSLINEDMQRKGREVGADEQLSKPEIGHLVAVIDKLIDREA